jgi:DNA polymerase III subunit gamma/tau
MTYIPLARKWRPQLFSDVLGQEPVTRTLTNAIMLDRVAAAYLFAGPRGVGKTSTARIFAKSLNCETGPTPTPCQVCVSCTAITGGNSLDVLEIDGASNRGIDQIRELREHVKYRPSHGRFKIYIIDEVHQITPDGFNALLKTLEEPPEHVRFIFATTHPDKVLPTILSRCQRFDFQRVPVPQMVSALTAIATQEKITVDKEACFAIARAADGSLRDAESMLDQLWNFSHTAITPAVVIELLGLVETDVVLEIIQAIVARDSATALRCIDAVINRGKEVSQLSGGLLEIARHLLVARSLCTEESATPWDALERVIELPRAIIERLATECMIATASEWLYIVQLLARSHETVKHSQQARVHLELVLVKIAIRADFSMLESVLSGTGPQMAPTVAAPVTPVVPATKKKVAQPRVHVATPASASEKPLPARREVSAVDQPEQRQPHVSHEPVAIETIQRDWGAIVDLIGKQRMAVASCFSSWKPLELVGDRLVMGIPDNTMHRELLDHNGNKKLVEQIIGEQCGIPRLVVTTRTVEVAAVPPKKAPKEQQRPADIVQAAIEMFNAKVVEKKS